MIGRAADCETCQLAFVQADPELVEGDLVMPRKPQPGAQEHRRLPSQQGACEHEQDRECQNSAECPTPPANAPARRIHSLVRQDSVAATSCPDNLTVWAR